MAGAQLAASPGPPAPTAQMWHRAKVAASGFVGEVVAIGFFPAMSDLSRKNYAELQPRQNQGRKYFKDILLYNILRY